MYCKCMTIWFLFTDQWVWSCWLATGNAFSHDQIQMSLAKDVPDVNHVAVALKLVSAGHWVWSDRFGSSQFVASRWQICYGEERLNLPLWYRLVTYKSHVIARVMAMHTGKLVFVVLANVHGMLLFSVSVVAQPALRLSVYTVVDDLAVVYCIMCISYAHEVIFVAWWAHVSNF